MKQHMRQLLWTYVVSGVILLLFSLVPVLGNCTSYKVIHWEEDPISFDGRFVNTLVQDNSGILWIGTEKGIYQFNGLQYELIPGVTKGRSFTSSLKDSLGNIWFGDREGKVFLRKQDRFQVYDDSLEVSSPIADIRQDPEGNIWFATQTDGIYQLDKHRHFRKILPGTPDRNVTSICPLDAHHALVGSMEGLVLFSFSGKSTRLDTLEEFKDNFIQVLTPRPGKQGVWVGTRREGMGFFYSRETIQKQIMPDSLQTSNVLAISEFENGKIWLSAAGIGVFPLVVNVTSQTVEPDMRFQGLENQNCRAIFQDREGLIWLANWGEGLDHLVPGAYSSLFTLEGNEIFGNLLFEDRRGKIWVGTKEGLVYADPISNTTRSFSPEDGLPAREVTAFYQDTDGFIWVGTAFGGVCRINPISFQIDKIAQSPRDQNQNYVHSIAENPEGEIWVATMGGILMVDLQKSLLVPVEGTMVREATQLLLDSKERMWVVYRDAPPQYVLKDKIFEVPAHGNEIVSLKEGKRGKIWVATVQNGLMFLQGDSLLPFVGEPLLDSVCNFLLIDPEGRIWIGHPEGFSSLTPESGKILQFNATREHVAHPIRNSGTLLRNNQIGFATSAGLMAYDYLDDLNLDRTPRVMLTSITINDESYALGVDSLLSFKLFSSQFLANFTYNAISFRYPGNAQFQYKLDGTAGGWSRLSKQTSTTIPFPGKGKYTFRVRAVNDLGLISETDATFSFQIRDPLFSAGQTKFLSVFGGIFIIVLVFSFVRYRVLRNEMQQQEEISQAIIQTQEEERRRFAADLHDHVKNSLARARFSLDNLSTKYSDNPEAQVLIDDTLGFINESIQEASAISQNIMPDTLKDLGLQSALEEYCRKSQTEEGPLIQLVFLGNHTEIPRRFWFPVYSIVKEATLNAIKSAEADLIHIQVNAAPRKLLITVEDDGKGFDFKKVSRKGTGLGLGNIQDRVKFFHGYVEFDSRPNKGTLVSIEIPMMNTALKAR